MQSRLLDEQAFRDTVAVLQASQARMRSQTRAQLASRLNQSMHQCLVLSRARTARLRRMARLKRTLEHQRGFAGADPQLMLHHAVLLSPRRGVQQGVGASEGEFVGDVRRPHARATNKAGCLVSDVGSGGISSESEGAMVGEVRRPHARGPSKAGERMSEAASGGISGPSEGAFVGDVTGPRTQSTSEAGVRASEAATDGIAVQPSGVSTQGLEGVASDAGSGVPHPFEGIYFRMLRRFILCNATETL